MRAVPRGADPEPAAGDPRWQAVLSRDRGADGTFVYSVETTGVYCRPSCAARRPNPRNVRFHETAAAAERAGFRPCKRCEPARRAPGQVAALVTKICRAIERAPASPRLAQLAASAGLSAHHLHRVFRRATGLTPRQYADGVRAGRMRAGLAKGRPVTRAMYDAGYGSSSRFYERASDVLGMSASEYRSGAPAVRISFATAVSSLGVVLVARTGTGICAILLGETAEPLIAALHSRFPRAVIAPAESGFDRLLVDVISLVDNPGSPVDLPLDIRGSAFQKRVWAALQRIPAGTTRSYGELAAIVGAPGSARAVARACAANPVAVAVPCHRVVRSDGTLGGYRWGTGRKRALLEREWSKSQTPNSQRPTPNCQLPTPNAQGPGSKEKLT